MNKIISLLYYIILTNDQFIKCESLRSGTFFIHVIVLQFQIYQKNNPL